MARRAGGRMTDELLLRERLEKQRRTIRTLEDEAFALRRHIDALLAALTRRRVRVVRQRARDLRKDVVDRDDEQS
jgi:hypothetical protein